MDQEIMVKEQQPACLSVWNDKNQFDQMFKAAQMLSQTSIIPQTYQGKPQDCFVAVEMATRMGVSPMVVMQNMFVVKGKPSWAGQACIMLINSCGKFRDVKHVYTGTRGTDNRGCYVTATRISDGEQVDGAEVTMQMAKAEGWTSNSKWMNMPELMLAYRAAAFFARVNCPEALMGVQTSEEVFDVAEKGTDSEFTNALLDDEEPVVVIPEPRQETIEERYGKMCARFAKLGVTEAQISFFLNKPIEDIAEEDFSKLTAIYGEIKKDATKISEYFITEDDFTAALKGEN